MNMCKTFGFVGVAAASLLLAGQAFATPVCPAGTAGNVVCLSNPGAQNALDALTTTPGQINAYTDQLSPSAYWTIGTNIFTDQIQFRVAGNSGDTFGIYDKSNSNNKLQLFSNSNNAGDLVGVRYTEGEGFSLGLNLPSDPSGYTKFGSGDVFGFYLTVNGTTFYSDPSLNEASGTYPNGTPHMVTYAGNNDGSIRIGAPGTKGTQLLGNEYLFGWAGEKFGSNGFNFTYNDLVTTGESITPVPAPAALGMFGLGLLLLGGAVAFRRRREGEVA